MNRTAVIARLAKFEGRVNHMYRCSGGETTIGVGHAIANAAAALRLAWSVEGRPATVEEVRADYTRVAAAAEGMVASRYADLSDCRMADAEIDRLVESDVERFTADLVRNFPEWGSYPAPAQEALFDMAFNLGLSGLKKKFPKMLAAADAGDWLAVAGECDRRGIAEARNQEIRELFSAAAKP